MPFNLTWESISSLFTPPATRSSSPNVTPSLSFGDFSKGAEQQHLSMPPSSAFGAEAGPAPPSSAESSASAAGESRFLAPNSPYSHQLPSLSTTSTATTASSASSDPQQHQLLPHHHHERSYTTPAPAPFPQDERPPAPRRSATYIVAPEPMSREFPKPAHEPTLDELLARQPCKRSLHYHVKNCRVGPAHPGEHAPQTEEEAAERARRFEETKRLLVADREKLAGRVVRQ